MNRRYGIAFVLLGVLGMAVALLHLFGAPAPTARLVIACLSVVVMVYGVYLAVKLKLNSVEKYARTKDQSNDTND